jgi:hypothetical protein
MSLLMVLLTQWHNPLLGLQGCTMVSSLAIAKGVGSVALLLGGVAHYFVG